MENYSITLEFKPLEVEPVLKACERLGIKADHLTGFAGPGPRCYSLTGPVEAVRQALSAALDETEIDELMAV